MPASFANDDGIEIIYFGQRDEIALLGLGQGLEDSSEKYPELKFRLKTELESFRPYKDHAALFVSMGAESLRILSMLNPELPIFNLVDDSEQVRDLCMKNIFHILPSKSMRYEAMKSWNGNQQKSENQESVAWDANINKGQSLILNEKFLTKRSVELTEQGWSGWVASRMFAEAFMQSKQNNSTVLETLTNGMTLNAYKDRDVYFRQDGQLAQTLFIKNGDEIIGQVPDSENNDEKLVTGRQYCEAT